MNAAKKKSKPRKRKLLATPVSSPDVCGAGSGSKPAPSSSLPTENLSQDPFGQMYYEEYSLVDDDVIAGLVDSDDDVAGPAPSTPLTQPNTPVTPRACPPLASPLATPSQSQQSFPSSPPPSNAFSTPSCTPHSPHLSGTPPPYPHSSYTPVERDYALDYEAAMIAVNDVNRFARFMFRGNPITGSDGLVYTKEDVLPTLRELKVMLVRMFDRLHDARGGGAHA